MKPEMIKSVRKRGKQSGNSSIPPNLHEETSVPEEPMSEAPSPVPSGPDKSEEGQEGVQYDDPPGTGEKQKEQDGDRVAEDAQGEHPEKDKSKKEDGEEPEQAPEDAAPVFESGSGANDKLKSTEEPGKLFNVKSQ